MLVLITSAAVAVTLAARRAGQRSGTVAFALIAAVFVYTTVANVIERPDGVKIGGLLHRRDHGGLACPRGCAGRSSCGPPTIELDATSQSSCATARAAPSGWSPTSPTTATAEEYADKIRQIRRDHDLPDDPDVIFVEVTVTDPSDFEHRLDVHGEVMHGRVPRAHLESSSVPNALAALLLHIRDVTGVTPHIYFEWTEGNPVTHFLRFLLFGQGEVAPVTREVLRRAEPVRAQRPHVHVG